MIMQPFRMVIAGLACILILTRTSLAQAPVKNYENEWKSVDKLIEKELLESALAQVNKIYQAAKKDKQDAQVIKALVYINTVNEDLQEENETKTIVLFEKEILASNEPARSILNNILAGLYLKYFQQHRWQLYQRTNTVNFNKTD